MHDFCSWCVCLPTKTQAEACQDNELIAVAGNPYQDSNGVFGDNQLRYALLSLAACEAPLQLHVGGYR